MSRPRRVVGVIADTHGEVPAAAIAALEDADHVIHAGDVEGRDHLDALGPPARVTAVRGNMDGPSLGRPQTALVEIERVAIYVLHDLADLELDPAAAGVRIVVHGHTHRADIAERGGVLYLNPGSASRPRGRRGASVARLVIEGGAAAAEIVPLDAGAPRRTR